MYPGVVLNTIPLDEIGKNEENSSTNEQLP
jgi:hypothetical protein